MSEIAFIPQKKTSFFKKIIFFLIFNLIIFLVLEGALRIAGFPRGIIDFTLRGEDGHYPNNQTIEIHSFGGRNYAISANSLGFRSNEMKVKKTEGVTRIATLGDSFTDGYFVDNPATYPMQLEKYLKDKGQSIEVINITWGGGSIAKELAQLKRFALPLKPDIILLGFYPNDFGDLKGLTREEILNFSWESTKKSSKRKTFEWFIRYTALGDALWEFTIWLQSPRFRKYHKMNADLSADERYNIVGGNDFAANLKLFQETGDKEMNAIEKYSGPEIQELMKNYFFGFDEFFRLCRENYIELIFVFMPAYSQIYDLDSSKALSEGLRAEMRKRKVPFIDLTPAFVERKDEGVFHLMPVDVHFNPRGYRVVAETLGQYLIEERKLA